MIMDVVVAYQDPLMDVRVIQDVDMILMDAEMDVAD